jgi:molybdopterin-guanine dinucleotide biosynthesis protein A
VPIGALVLAGGASRRLGEDKTAALIDGVPLLDRVLGALGDDVEVIVVGPPRRTARPVRFVLEQPPGGGPVAALAAGLAELATDRCFLLAADLPFLTAEALAQLARAGGPHMDGAVAVDGSGREQPLLSYWVTGALRAALPPVPAGARLREMLSRLSYVTVRLAGDRPPEYDCDTPEALERARTWA